MCDGVFYVFEGEMKVAPNAKRQLDYAADPVIEFVDEIPSLIPANVYVSLAWGVATMCVVPC
jgi:hypothetical protein